MFGSTLVPLALAASALANVFITSPVTSTTMTGGQQASITWMDDGKQPSLAQFGNATIGIYTGNAVVQTPLQMIPGSINVSAMSSISFTPDATIGPDSNEYFIRFTSLSYMNPSTPQYAEEAFSAKFTLTGMTGSFNSTVQAEINGQSTAPIGGTTSASGTPAATGKTTTTTTAKSTSSPAATSTNGAGKPIITTGLVALVAALIGASLL
ncbi:hypothetical protein J3R82DRAFT_8161 [Butyriboletus roseoflavus]|nr:hypothetical protein J3R82DRAFT_8161 [Butyriboletus roseoflavus]